MGQHHKPTPRFVLAVVQALLLLTACGTKSGLTVEPSEGDTGTPIAPDAAPDTAPPDTAPPDTGPTPCVPTPEACNLRDDDCDGTVDEGLGFGALTEPTVVRVDEGETGSCTSCRWAWDPVITPVGAGYRAFFWVGISGGDEMPNLFARDLDARLQPTSPVQLATPMPDGYVLDMGALTTRPVAGSGVPLAACLRPAGSFGDRAGWALLRADGSFEFQNVPEVGTCDANTDTFWSGERIISARSERDATGSWELQITAARLDGTYAETQRVPVPDLYGVRGGAFQNRVALIGIIVRPEEEHRSLDYTRLDARGRIELGHQPMPDVPYSTRLRIIGVPEGWLLVDPGSPSRDIPATRQLIDLDGRAITEPLPWPDGRAFSDSGISDVFIRHPSEPAIIAAWQTPARRDEVPDMFVELWDERGDPQQSWRAPAPGVGVFASPSVSAGDDRLTVAWHDIAGNGEPNRVFAQHFGCLER